MLKRIINMFGLKFEATQYVWGRKLFGGIWYFSGNGVTYPFWSDKFVKCCGSFLIKMESYNE